jgi:hypothetical protein
VEPRLPGLHERAGGLDQSTHVVDVGPVPREGHRDLQRLQRVDGREVPEQAGEALVARGGVEVQQRVGRDVAEQRVAAEDHPRLGREVAQVIRAVAWRGDGRERAEGAVDRLAAREPHRGHGVGRGAGDPAAAPEGLAEPGEDVQGHAAAEQERGHRGHLLVRPAGRQAALPVQVQRRAAPGRHLARRARVVVVIVREQEAPHVGEAPAPGRELRLQRGEAHLGVHARIDEHGLRAVEPPGVHRTHRERGREHEPDHGVEGRRHPVRRSDSGGRCQPGRTAHRPGLPTGTTLRIKLGVPSELE